MDEQNSESNHARFAGMTVNERLFVAGILDQFDDAARRRDRQAMLAYLIRVLPDKAATETTDAILANPRYYRL